MKPIATFLAALLALALPACSVTQKDASAREWQRTECNRILDKEDRERCLKRIE